MSDYKYVGKRIVKEDCYDKATGKTKFICDMKRHNMLYAKIVQSEKSHAIVTIDKDDALNVDGIVAVFTYEDVPKIKYNSYQWFAGAKADYDEYLLNKEAKFVGDRIALVVGESKRAVEKAASLVKVEYEELESIIGINSAKEKNSLAFTKTVECGDIDGVFENADYVVESTGVTPKIHHSAIETHICLTEYDEQDNLVVWTPCQIAFQVQHHVATALDIPYNCVRAIKAKMGGSFGGKGQTILEPICAFATVKLKRPVMLYMNRKDCIRGTVSRNASKMDIRTAVTKDGKILAREIKMDFDGGAYNTNASAVAMAAGKKLFRMYNIENQRFVGSTYYTNTLPGGACRGYGSPQAHAVSEINLDKVANKLGIDPCEFRLKNLVDAGAKDPTGGPDIGNAQVKKCVTEGMKHFDWKEKRENIKKNDTDRYAYGVGMACGCHGNGYKGANPDYMDLEARIMPDNSVLIKAALHDQGCGTITTIKQIAAESLDIGLSRIRLTEADTMITPYDSAGTQASRVTFVCGGAVKEATTKLKEKMISIYAQLKNCNIEDVKCSDGYIWANEEDKSTYGEIAIQYELHYSKTLSEYTRYESPANPATFTACFAQVKVDKYTGMVDIEKFLAVHDIGQCINPLLVEGQIQGGAHMSLGMALREEIDIDKNGVVKSSNFSKYHLINAPEMPKVEVLTIEDGEEYGPYGAKSVGEAAAVAPAPAVINAINHALDTNICDFPATPERIINAIREKRI